MGFEDIYADKVNDILAETRRHISKLAISGMENPSAAFESTMTNMNYRVPSLFENLQSLFGADITINAIAESVEKWKHDTPPNQHLVLTLRTPDGRVMDVTRIEPNGWQSFLAEGFANGMPCMMTGHISTLSLFGSYEDDKGKKPLGFTIVTGSVTGPQTEFVPTQPGSK